MSYDVFPRKREKEKVRERERERERKRGTPLLRESQAGSGPLRAIHLPCQKWPGELLLSEARLYSERATRLYPRKRHEVLRPHRMRDLHSVREGFAFTKPRQALCGSIPQVHFQQARQLLVTIIHKRGVTAQRTGSGFPHKGPFMGQCGRRCIPLGGVRGFRWVQKNNRNVTKFSPYLPLKLIASGKLTFDEMVDFPVWYIGRVGSHCT